MTNNPAARFAAVAATLTAAHHVGDSMAWSYAARRRDPLPGCSGHMNCANCAAYALTWRAEMLAHLPRWHQPTLAEALAA